MEELKKMEAEEELQKCSFRPHINKRSDKLMHDRMCALRAFNMTAHDQLFQDAQRRRARQVRPRGSSPVFLRGGDRTNEL